MTYLYMWLPTIGSPVGCRSIDGQVTSLLKQAWESLSFDKLDLWKKSFWCSLVLRILGGRGGLTSLLGIESTYSKPYQQRKKWAEVVQQNLTLLFEEIQHWFLIYKKTKKQCRLFWQYSKIFSIVYIKENELYSQFHQLNNIKRTRLWYISYLIPK